ncbi:hypothetical protein LCM08_07765 [Salipiger pacificus]|nr:hypothetical protein [Alloyangia pacifica]MCA0944803.1 hypothetical protein [Alloyangia pacifica]
MVYLSVVFRVLLSVPDPVYVGPGGKILQSRLQKLRGNGTGEIASAARGWVIALGVADAP